MNTLYHCGKFPKKYCHRSVDSDCNGCPYYKTTIKQYFQHGGIWNVLCDMSTPYRSMTVNVGFLNEKGDKDETQFDINAYDIDELNDLFNMFCQENNYSRNTVQYINVVAVMEEKKLVGETL